MMTTTEVDIGVTGAKRQSWRKINAREVLLRIVKENPELTLEELQVEFWDVARRDAELQRAIADYWVDNNYHRLIVRPRRARLTTPDMIDSQKAVVQTALRDQFEAVIEERVSIVLLDMVLPTGKTVRQSTREELLAVGGRFHGFCVRLAERLLPQQTVDAAGFTEDQVRESY